MKLYGLTVEEFEEIERQQGGVCRICQCPPTGRRNGGRLHVDHDHETGEVRGLLCYHCNNGLGRFKDDPELLRSAAKYLELSRG